MNIEEKYAKLLEKAKASNEAWLTLPSEVVGWDDGWTSVESQFITESRWYNVYRTVFEKDGEYLAVFDRRGATEMQDSMTIADSTPEYYKVEPIEVLTVEYRKVKE